MEPIRPIGPKQPDLPAVERVWPDGERERHRRDEEQRRKRQQPPRPATEPDEDDGLPHIDVSV
jgi:hypothetical protein